MLYSTISFYFYEIFTKFVVVVFVVVVATASRNKFHYDHSKRENKYYKEKQLRNVITHGTTKEKTERKKQDRKNRSFLSKLISSLSGNTLQNLFICNGA